MAVMTWWSRARRPSKSDCSLVFNTVPLPSHSDLDRCCQMDKARLVIDFPNEEPDAKKCLLLLNNWEGMGLFEAGWAPALHAMATGTLVAEKAGMQFGLSVAGETFLGRASEG